MKLKFTKMLKNMIVVGMIFCLATPVFAEELSTTKNDSSAKEKVEISFEFCPAGTGRADVINHTTETEYDVRSGSIEVDKGDSIEVRVYGLEGNEANGLYRNGKDCFSTEDTIASIEEDTHYKVLVSKIKFDYTFSTENLDFDEAKAGYDSIPEKEVKLTNNVPEGGVILDVKDIESEFYDIDIHPGEGCRYMQNRIYIFSGGSCTYTIKPKDGLPEGDYSEKLEFYYVTYDPADNDYLLGSVDTKFTVTSEKTDNPLNDDVDKNDAVSEETNDDQNRNDAVSEETNDDQNRNDAVSEETNNHVSNNGESDAKIDTQSEDTAAKDVNPKTGDSSQIMIYGIVSMMSILFIAYLIKKRKSAK